MRWWKERRNLFAAPTSVRRRGRHTSWAFLLLFLVSGQASAQSSALLESAREIFGGITAPTEDEISHPRARLGRALFWDTRLSANGAIACASCHPAEGWGADRRRQSIDARGRPTSRHAQTVFNAQQATDGLRWVADRATGAAQALGSITGSMGFEERGDLLPALAQHGYANAFALAFPEDEAALSAEHYAAALEAYQRTLRTPSAFDRWLEGDSTALSNLELEGLRRFVSLGCAGCHDGPLLGGNQLRPFGVVERYVAYTGSAAVDDGLFRTTGDEQDRGV